MERVPRRARVSCLWISYFDRFSLFHTFSRLIVEFDSRGEEDWKGKGHLCFYNYIFVVIFS